MTENKQNVVIDSGEKEIDLLEILKSFWTHKWIIISLMFLFGAAMFVKVTYFTPDTYSTEGILYVSNRVSNKDPDNAISRSDIDTSRIFGETVIEVLKTSHFLEDVGNSAGGFDWKQIRRMINISAINETELLNVRVVGRTPEDVYNIANAFLALAPNKLKAVDKRGEVELIDEPRMPVKPDDKGLAKNVVLGCLIGAFLGMMIIFLIGFFDKKVRKSEDVVKRYNISILGEIADQGDLL